jgi:hypothetical protein
VSGSAAHDQKKYSLAFAGQNPAKASLSLFGVPLSEAITVHLALEFPD